MAGCVGSDVLADRLRAELSRAGVDISRVEVSPKPSGSATIFVLPNGENTIVISAGANGANSVAFATDVVGALRPGDFLLCQLEIPLESVEAAITAAAAKGVTTILDPAPASELPAALLKSVAILTPNQTEARALLRWSSIIETIPQAEQAARELQGLGPRIVIIKLGSQGCVVADRETVTHVPGFAVPVVDTTAAGDCFNGALAAGLAEEMPLPEAVHFANAAAALSVTKPGAISSMPRRVDVDSLL
jgi:ribokinase